MSTHPSNPKANHLSLNPNSYPIQRLTFYFFFNPPQPSSKPLCVFLLAILFLTPMLLPILILFSTTISPQRDHNLKLSTCTLSIPNPFSVLIHNNFFKCCSFIVSKKRGLSFPPIFVFASKVHKFLKYLPKDFPINYKHSFSILFIFISNFCIFLRFFGAPAVPPPETQRPPSPRQDRGKRHAPVPPTDVPVYDDQSTSAEKEVGVTFFLALRKK